MKGMDCSRRSFIGGAAAFCGASFLRVADAAQASGARLKLGVLSDIHVNGAGSEKWFVKALEYYRGQGVDAVMIAGDLANIGRIDELQRVADAWFKVFPDDRGADGRHVERLFVYGNHCILGWRWGHGGRPPLSKDEEGAKRNAIGWGDNRARAWRECFHEDFAPIWMKTVKGCSFVGAHWEERGDGIAVRDFMAKHGSEIDPSQPFFYCQHAHPKDTCFGPWAWGHDDGRATQALSPFPNAIAVSGHSHYSLTDERSIWQGAFTSLNAGSLFDTSTEYSLRENGRFNRYGYKGEKDVRTHAMPEMRPIAHQGSLISVYDDRLAIHRREFDTDRALGEDWVLPLPAAEKKPFAFAARKATRVAPAFAADAKVTVKAGKDGKGNETVEVSFPPAETVKGCRVFEYEVTATLVEDGVDLVQAQRRVLDPDYYLPEPVADRQGCTCVFAAAELPLKGRYRFSVRPLECFGVKGREISALWACPA